MDVADLQPVGPAELVRNGDVTPSELLDGPAAGGLLLGGPAGHVGQVDEARGSMRQVFRKEVGRSGALCRLAE